MGHGDETMSQPADEDVRRHLRIGAQQDLSRARAGMEHAAEPRSADPQALTRLEQIERELTELRESTGLSRKRNERTILALLLSQRLILDQLGFGSHDEYVAWSAVLAPIDDEGDDAAYLEFARLELDAAQERLAELETGALDLDVIEPAPADLGELAPYVTVPLRVDVDLTLAAPDPNAAPLEAWTDPFAGRHEGPSPAHEAHEADEAAAALPHLDTSDLDDLDLPYWSEPA